MGDAGPEGYVGNANPGCGFLLIHAVPFTLCGSVDSFTRSLIESI